MGPKKEQRKMNFDPDKALYRTGDEEVIVLA